MTFLRQTNLPQLTVVKNKSNKKNSSPLEKILTDKDKFMSTYFTKIKKIQSHEGL
jgi:hypothetical protein